MKNTVTKTKFSPDGLKSRMEMQMRVTEFEERSIVKVSNMNNKRGKLNRASRTCGENPKGLTLMSSEFQKERRTENIFAADKILKEIIL